MVVNTIDAHASRSLTVKLEASQPSVPAKWYNIRNNIIIIAVIIKQLINFTDFTSTGCSYNPYGSQYYLSSKIP